MDQLELGKFVGETTARYDALDRRISEQGKSLRADMASLRQLVESRMNGRGRNGYREKVMWGGVGGGLITALEFVRHLVS